MNYTLIEKIKTMLMDNGFSEHSDHISKIIRSGSTSGEITIMVLNYLKKIIKEKVEINNLIGESVIEFEEYAASIGIHSW